MTEKATREPRPKQEKSKRRKAPAKGRSEKPTPESEGSSVEIRRKPEDATPENPLEFRYILTFKPRRYRGKNWTGSGRATLKPVEQVAAKQRKRTRR